ncbi:MAG: hypothetical protein LBQ00_01430 [Syntrophobacterales bacterium]|nr:hypothetical protein [Syntrophobacterales bacterium]
MKKLTICFLALLVLAAASVAFAAPFLVSNPYPAKRTTPSQFLITINEKTETSIPAKNEDGSVYLKYDLGGLSDGTYTVYVKAINKKGVESSPSVYSFIKTGSMVEAFIPPTPKEKRNPSRSSLTYKNYPGYINR